MPAHSDPSPEPVDIRSLSRLARVLLQAAGGLQFPRQRTDFRGTYYNELESSGSLVGLLHGPCPPGSGSSRPDHEAPVRRPKPARSPAAGQAQMLWPRERSLDHRIRTRSSSSLRTFRGFMLQTSVDHVLPLFFSFMNHQGLFRSRVRARCGGAWFLDSCKHPPGLSAKHFHRVVADSFISKRPNQRGHPRGPVASKGQLKPRVAGTNSWLNNEHGAVQLNHVRHLPNPAGPRVAHSIRNFRDDQSTRKPKSG